MAWMDSEGKLHDDGVFPELKDRAVEKPDAHSVLSDVGEPVLCIFCGSHLQYHILCLGVHRSIHVTCDNCRMMGPMSDTSKDHALELYLRRANVR